MKKANILVLILVAQFFAAYETYAGGIQDPIQHFYANYEIFKEDELIIFRVDLNEDGREEVFVSTTSERRNNAKAGRLWELYISGDQGYSHHGEKSNLGVSLHVPGSLVRLNNGRLAIIGYHASSARQGSIMAYYLDGNDRLQYEVLGEIYAEPGQDEDKFKRIISDKRVKALNKPVEYKTILLEQVYSRQQIAKLNSYEEDFWATHTFRNDPNSPGTLNQLVYRKSDGKFVGYLINSEFVPVSEADRASDSLDDANVNPASSSAEP